MMNLKSKDTARRFLPHSAPSGGVALKILPRTMLQSTMADDLSALLDAAVDGIVLIDHTGIIRVFNRAAERLFGFTATEVRVAMSRSDEEEDAALHDGYLRHYLQTRIPKIIGRGREVTARRKDGSTFPAFLSVGVAAGFESIRFVGFIQDLSARRSAEEEARRLQERLSQVSRLATMGEMASALRTS